MSAELLKIMDIVKINDRLSYIKASEQPLSADVGIFKGKSFIWIFDLGANESVLNTINSLDGKKNAVISHFHPDHMKNLEHAVLNEVFLGANTFKYAKLGTVVTDDVFIDDGEKIHIFLIPSSHAKGSVGMEIGEYAFLGDTTYPTVKGGKACYNVSVLKEEISVLKNLEAKYFLLSHNKNFIRKKEDVIKYLEEIYSNRNPKESYIYI